MRHHLSDELSCARTLCELAGGHEHPNRIRLSIRAERWAPDPARSRIAEDASTISRITMVGELDASAVDAAATACLRHIVTVGNTVIDLAGVTLIDSAGVALLETLCSFDHTGCDVALLQQSPIVRRVLSILDVRLPTFTPSTRTG